MNEMDLLSRLREEVPLGVSPGAEQLFRAALIESDNPGGEAVPSLPSGGPRAARRGLRVAWRPVLAVPLALGVAAAVGVAVLPSHGHGPGPGAARDPAGHSARGRAASNQPAASRPESPVQLLADRAAAAALTGPNVQPGQWVYRQTDHQRKPTKGRGRTARRNSGPPPMTLVRGELLQRQARHLLPRQEQQRGHGSARFLPGAAQLPLARLASG